MNIRSKTALLALPLAIALNACSPSSDQKTEQPGEAESSAPSMTEAGGSSGPSAMETASEPAPVAGSAKVIGLEGLGDLRLGQPVPKGSTWAERGAQEGGGCRTVNSPDYPGAYAMVIDGKVRRITLGKRSDVKLAEGIGVSASERDVGKWFAGFRSEPHKYEPAPAKYLTAPNAGSGDPAVRFEIGQDGKVMMIHVGMMPELAYVEGCS